MKTKILLITGIVILCMGLILPTASYARARIDISDKVVWDTDMEMYIPVAYTHYCYFEDYNNQGQKIVGGVFVNLPSVVPNKFDLYISLSAKSSAEVYLTNVTFEEIPDHELPYTAGDYGSIPCPPGGKDILFDFTTQPNGFGGVFLDWQIVPGDPEKKHALEPGMVYLDDPSNTTEFTVNQFTGLKWNGRWKNKQGKTKIMFDEGSEGTLIPVNVEPIPEPATIASLLFGALGVALFKRFKK